MKLAHIASFLALTVFAAGCGPAADVAEKSSSALTPGTFYQSAVLNGVKQPLTTAGPYACQNDTWWLLQPIFQRQITTPGNWRDELTVVPPALDSPTQNIATLVCAFSMTKVGSTYLYSNQDVVCTMYTHRANGPWQWSGSVLVPTYGLQYFPATWNYTNGRWVIDLWSYPQYVGQPGFCDHVTVTIAG